jgi:hypothetical protein
MASIVAGAKIIGMKILEEKLQKAFEAWARFEVNDYFRDQFNTEKWDYPNITFRKNRDAVGPEPRDIFDLGNLYRSGRDSFKITKGTDDATASWDWDAKNSSGNLYAYYVHEGQGTNLRPRKWTDALVNRDLFLASTLNESLVKRIRASFAK